MDNQKRTISEGLHYLLEDEQERIVFGALKRLHVAPYSVEFDDFLQEARITFAKSYVRFPDDPRENDMRFHVFAYQAVYWNILDLIRSQIKRTEKVAISDEDDGDGLLELPSPQKMDVVEQVTCDYFFERLYEICSNAERRFLKDCYIDQLSGSEIAKKEQFSRQCVYRWRKTVGIKALRIMHQN